MIATGAGFSLYCLLIPFVSSSIIFFLSWTRVVFGAGKCLFSRHTVYLQRNYYCLAVCYTYFLSYRYVIGRNALGCQAPESYVFLYRSVSDLVYAERLPGPIIICAGCAAAVLMLLIGIWAFLKNQDHFILYI